jgi:organic hydroperoxide reductase OsmC/OhrA
MSKQHSYKAEIKWTGNLGTGTSEYTAYSRNYEVSGDNGREIIKASADPVYRGEASRYNPEELLLAAIAGCHMLWYLHLCADAGVTVVDYKDEASGILTETDDGNGKFSEATITPRVTITKASDAESAEKLHEKAHEFCFIANSLNFPVRCEPTIVFENEQAMVN